MTLRKCRVHGHLFPPEHFRIDHHGHLLCRETEKIRHLRYEQTPGAAARFKRYDTSERGCARWVKYNMSERGRARFTRYEISEKGQARNLIHRWMKTT